MKHVLVTILAFLALGSKAHAWISEESDNLTSSHCVGATPEDDMEVSTSGKSVTGWYRSSSGIIRNFTGQLLSVTIDTDDSSLNLLAQVNGLEFAEIRYLTIKDKQSLAIVAVHRNISDVLGILGEARCTAVFKK